MFGGPSMNFSWHFDLLPVLTGTVALGSLPM